MDFKKNTFQKNRYAVIAAFILLNSFCLVKAQPQLSDDAVISILTCSPGEELYATFGHTSIRVNDPANNIDLAYNYGTFDFHVDWFYLKFARGGLNYKLSVHPYNSFWFEYKNDERSIWEQTLNLSQNEKQRLFEALTVNAQPENREYKYHFFFDNCATRIRDMIVDNLDCTLKFEEPDYVGTMTFRTTIATYLEKKTWTKFGLDLILGKPTDDFVDKNSVQFLPDYLMEQLALARRDSDNSMIVANTNTILEFDNYSQKTFWTPVIIFSIVCLIVILISIYDFRKNKCSRWLDFILFSAAGLLGVLIVFLWFFTSHTVTGPNWHILWANPLLLILMFINSYSTGYKYFTFILVGLQFFCLLCFAAFTQYMPLTLIPIWIMLIIRMFLRFSEVRHFYVVNQKRKKNADNANNLQ
ncbi:MAG: DUF4105 domain-containing protein [Cytophagaceae bacterium]|jgi:hypothetical protein|nr:DUF4105 domain-containing protein [Cytophagaceae bacterium]